MASHLNYIGDLQKGCLTVLMIPGGMATSPAVYEGIGETLACQSAVIDWSRSPGPWDVLDIGDRTLELVKELELGPVILAGYSAGGVIAMEAAIQDRENRISGLLLSNTGPCTVGHGDPDLPKRILGRWFSMELFEPFLDRCFAFPIDPALREKLLDYARQIPVNVVYEAAKTLREHDLRPRLEKITCPVVIAHGILDRTRTLEHVRMITDGVKDTQVHLLDGGHTIMVEDRDEWVAILNCLITQIASQTKERAYGQR